MSSKTVIRCSKCGYCKELAGGPYSRRSSFFCEHPDRKYIEEYYKKNRIYRLLGFIDFGRPNKHVPGLRTSPKWCPKKAE